MKEKINKLNNFLLMKNSSLDFARESIYIKTFFMDDLFVMMEFGKNLEHKNFQIFHNILF